MHRSDIKGLRRRLDLTQEQFAELLPVDRRTVLRWELGDMAPSPLAVHRLKQLTREHAAKVAADTG